MGNRKRNLHLHVMVTAEELEQIHARMAEAGISKKDYYYVSNKKKFLR